MVRFGWLHSVLRLGGVLHATETASNAATLLHRESIARTKVLTYWTFLS